MALAAEPPDGAGTVSKPLVSGEVVASPRFVSAAVTPGGQVGLLFQNWSGGVGETRFKRYTTEQSTDPSIQLSTVAPGYPQLATFRGELVAAYVAASGQLAFRISTDNGATWAADAFPLGAATFDSGSSFSPVVVSSRDAQSLYVFSATNGTVPQYRASTDPALVNWSAAAAAGDATMRAASNNNCGNAGQECYRAHSFQFMETAVAGRWLYIAKSDSGFGQSGRGTQYGTLGGAWSAQIDLGGSGGLSGGGESNATSFLDRSGNVYYLRATEGGDNVYFQRSTDSGASWGPRVYAYSSGTQPYLTGSPVGLYVSGYTQGEYAWWAGFGGTEDTVRVDGIWTQPAAYPDTGTARLFGSAGGDWDAGLAYAFTFGRGDPDASTGTGVYTTTATDLALPGRLLPFAFIRTYNSADIAPGPLGRGWTHSYNWSLTENGNLVQIRRGDGRRDRFTRNPDGTYAAPPNVYDTLTKNADASYTLTTPSQVQYEFVGPSQISPYPNAVQASAPVAYWRLGEISGTAAADSGPNNLTGTYSGGVSLGVPGALNDPTTAVAFDGATGQVSAGAMGIPNGTSARTVEAWVKPNGGGGAVFAANAASGQRFVLLDLLYGGTWYAFTDGINGANNIALGGSQVPPLGQWSHIAVVFDGAAQTWHYYLNGVQAATGTFPIPFNSSPATSATIGARLDNSQPYNGSIDEVAVYATALSAADIAAHYRAVLRTQGLLSRIHEPTGNVVSLGYSGVKLSTMTDTAGRQVRLDYDSGGHLRSIRDPAGRMASYAYDSTGRLVSEWDKITTGTGRYPQTVLADAPAAYWRLGETSGTVAADASANGNTGTYSGGYTLGQLGPLLQDPTGAVAFDGSSGTVTAGVTGIPSGTSARTVEAWVQRSGNGGSVLATNTAGGQRFVFYGGYLYSDGATYLFTDGVNSNNNIVLSGPEIPQVGTWSHVALAFDGPPNTWHYYLNGVLTKSGSFAVPINTGTPTSMTIATRLDVAQPFGGVLDEVAIYPTALSGAQIAAHYQAGQIPASWRYAYDGASQHVASITDPDGRVAVTNTYDSQGRLSTQRDGLGKQTSFTYGTSTTTITDPRLHATTQTFDPRQRLFTTSDVVSGTTRTLTYGYDTSGNRNVVIDRDGNRTDFTYDARGNVLTKLDPQIDPFTPRYLTSFQYDAKNNLTQVTDPRSFVTTNTYDPSANVLLSTSRQIDATTNAVTKFEYGDATNPGVPTRIIAPRGNTGPTPNYAFAQTLGYDAQGNLTSRTDADGNRTTYAYDTLGRRTSLVDPDGNAPGGVPADHTWTTAYDANDRTTRETDPLGNALGYGYDKTGNRTTLTDRRGNVTTYAYDLASRLATVKQKPDPAGQPTLVYTTSITRDDNGNATRITQANGVVTDYGFDELNRQISVTTRPSGTLNLTTNYTLNGNGQPTTKTLGDGTAITYAYDTNARLLSVSAAGLSTIGYGYDARSQRTSMTDGTGTSTYSYDGLGRMTQAVQPNGTIGYGYDLDSNRTSLTYPGPVTVSYVFSNAGRLSSLTDWGNRTSTYAYSPAGLAKTLALPNGMVTTYAYDRAQRLTSLSNAVGATTISSHAYTLDAEGNRVALDEFVFGITLPGASDHFTLGYDGLERLTSVAVTNPEGFTLDPASNISSRSGPSATYSYDQANRLTSDGTNAFVWSNADRLASRGLDTFGYDALDRLTSSSVAGTPRSYAYNGDGLVQSRSTPLPQALLWDPATSPSRLLQQGTDRLVYGLGPLYSVSTAGTTTFARDGGKSIRAEVSDLGVATVSFRYRAYGQIAQAQPAAATPTSLGYAGQLTDPSGLLYMRARWYDPATGRFLTRDPLTPDPTAPRSNNPYLYAAANPIAFTDPTGADCEAEDISVGVPEGCVEKGGGSPEGVTGSRAAEGGGLGLSEAFHYTRARNLPSIEQNGLRAGSYVTPNGALSPLQAQIDLALPPNRGLPDAVIRIDLEGLRAAGYEFPNVTRVGRSFNMPGGGYEMQFPYSIPREFLKVGIW